MSTEKAWQEYTLKELSKAIDFLMKENSKVHSDLLNEKNVRISLEKMYLEIREELEHRKATVSPEERKDLKLEELRELNKQMHKNLMSRNNTVKEFKEENGNLRARHSASTKVYVKLKCEHAALKMFNYALVAVIGGLFFYYGGL